MYMRLDADIVFSNWIKAGSVEGVKMARLEEARARGRNHSVERTLYSVCDSVCSEGYFT